MIKTIVVSGAGTMGSGIALVCARGGFQTKLYDVSPETLVKSRSYINESLGQLVRKGKMTTETSDTILERLIFTGEPRDCVADLIIEAIIEKPGAKIALFNELALVNSPGCLFATNTSSIAVSLLQQSISNPGRLAGMHFFNPAPVMKLVEVVVGNQTSASTVASICGLCLALDKTPVVCKDSPGFIVNRIARHYYLEAMKIGEAGIASIEDIDEIMESTGFKMGPFKLIDLIGMDVNLAVSQGIYESFNHAERFVPASMQIEKVNAGELGKKSGKGFYDYSS